MFKYAINVLYALIEIKFQNRILNKKPCSIMLFYFVDRLESKIFYSGNFRMDTSFFVFCV